MITWYTRVTWYSTLYILDRNTGSRIIVLVMLTFLDKFRQNIFSRWCKKQLTVYRQFVKVALVRDFDAQIDEECLEILNLSLRTHERKWV